MPLADLHTLLSIETETLVESPNLLGARRNLAIIKYVLRMSSPDQFRSDMTEYINLSLESFDLGAGLRYELIYDGLAAGDFALARRCAAELLLDDQSAWLGLGVRALIEGDVKSAAESFDKCAAREEYLVGISALARGIIARDVHACSAAVVRMTEDHSKRLRRGMFRMRLDYHLFVWGIGLLNFARGVCGLDVKGKGPAMPDDLLVPVGELKLG